MFKLLHILLQSVHVVPCLTLAGFCYRCMVSKQYQLRFQPRDFNFGSSDAFCVRYFPPFSLASPGITCSPFLIVHTFPVLTNYFKREYGL
jgi:hypothetical protein